MMTEGDFLKEESPLIEHEDLSASDHMALSQNKRVITWTELKEGARLIFETDNYWDAKVVKKGFIHQYKIECRALNSDSELFLMEGEQFIFSVPSIAMGDKIFYALRFKDLLRDRVLIEVVKRSERIGDVLRVEPVVLNLEELE